MAHLDIKYMSFTELKSNIARSHVCVYGTVRHVQAPCLRNDGFTGYWTRFLIRCETTKLERKAFISSNDLKEIPILHPGGTIVIRNGF
ncbi:hypothetical protein EDD11_001006, partial [Mortierella claussenii]